jgi:hypothetical protein
MRTRNTPGIDRDRASGEAAYSTLRFLLRAINSSTLRGSPDDRAAA